MGCTTRSLPVGWDARQGDEPNPVPTVQNSLLRERQVAVATALKEKGSGLANKLDKMGTTQTYCAERAGLRGCGEDEDSVW